MVEAAAATFVAGWLTPTSLFILLNVVVGTILISSAFGNSHQNNNKNTSHSNNNNNSHSNNINDNDQYPPQLARAPSLFTRVTSFNFSHNYHYDPQPHQPDHDTARPNHEPATPAPTLLSRVTSFCRTNDPYPTYPAQPESKPVATSEAPVVTRPPSLLSRVASFGLYRPEPAQPVTVTAQAPFPRAEESNPKPKPKPKAATKKPKQVKKKDVVGTSGERVTTVKDEEVDTKADDFINKFKQQLKLQRIESLLRYRNSAS